MRTRDAEYFRVLDALRQEDEYLFRFGITHLLSVGYENLTEEAVQRTIEVIEKEALEEDEDSIPVITPEYQIAILKMAAKIREVPVWELLKFISRIRQSSFWRFSFSLMLSIPSLRCSQALQKFHYPESLPL